MSPSKSRSNRTKQPKRKRSRRDSDADPVSDEEASDLDSDALDDEPGSSPRKRKLTRTSTGKSKTSPRRKKATQSEEAEEGYALDLKEGQEVVGVVVQAPREGQGTFPPSFSPEFA